MLITAAVLALAIAPTLAIPPPTFGFPEAPNDTALVVSFPQTSGAAVPVREAVLFGGAIATEEPRLGVNSSAYQSIAEYTGEYIVMMVDPDASYPENPDKRFYLHWLQPNLTVATQTSDIGRRLTAAANAVVPYTMPSPPDNSSAHRYIVYAFEQPSNFTIPSQWSGLSAENRTSFNLTTFITDTYLGTPAAANYFYVSKQRSVPADFVGSPGSQYPGGDGTAVTSGDPYMPTAAGSTSSSTAGAAMITGVGALLGAGLAGFMAMA